MAVVLVLRALKLGDLLVAVPALHALQRAFPQDRLLFAAQAWLTPIVELVEGFELLDTHGLDVAIPLPPGQVDVAVNLHGGGPQSRGRLDALRPRARMGHRFHGVGPRWDGPDWVDGIHERVRWTSLVSWYGFPANPDEVWLLPPPDPSPRPGAAVVHAGAGYRSRHWPVQRFAAVARALVDGGHEVVVTGNATERDRCLEIATEAGLAEADCLAGRITLGELASLVARSEVVVSADTGAAHLASAYARPSVVLFGPAPISEWGPPPGPHVALTREELRLGDVFAAEPDPALLGVSTTDVLAALEGLGVAVSGPGGTPGG